MVPPRAMDTLHPAAIHLPLALVLLWPIVDGLGLWAKSPHLSRLALGLLVLAAVASLFATATGQAAFDEAVRRGVDGALLRTHTEDADLMPWALLALAGLRAWLPTKLGGKGRGVALALGLLLIPFAFSVGRSGGKLVYEHGVGVWAGSPDVDEQPAKR